jgi:hypothetical protein
VNSASVHPAVYVGHLSSRRCCLQVEDTTQAIFFNTGQACTAVRICKLVSLTGITASACLHSGHSMSHTNGYSFATVRLQASRTFVHEDVYDKVNSIGHCLAHLPALDLLCHVTSAWTATRPTYTIKLDRHSVSCPEQFVEKAAAKAKSYKIGNTLDPGTHIGAQVPTFAPH